ncbi:XRE family transcriptional regulator [Streptomyces scabiei]|uniref:MmyB family transcriptional regulator n=1 Tax=Streptomyces scabiei TaxID=1930 RepID=UPI0029B9F150|nr:XRE family transcriptional regulator [Streptomyces scabiei]MDX3165856.1 XRE family transcriptional regulator [Streptomyces scabiei]
MSAQRVHPLAMLLQPKRARIRPEEMGLRARPADAPGPKQDGLTQSQMDELLNRADKTYGRFERGKILNPPDDLLTDVGRLLRLTQDEYTTMWLYARGHRPTVPLDEEAGTTVSRLWQEACDGQRHMMYVTDLAWNTLAYNAAFADMFHNRQVPANTARWMLLTEEARHTLKGWEGIWAPSVSAQLQAALAEYPDNVVLQQIDKEVRADPVAGPIYINPEVASIAPDGVCRPFHHPLHGPGIAKLVAAAPYASPGARAIVVIYEPDDT